MERALQERIGLNEATLRRVNEAIQSGLDAPTHDEMVSFLCECARLGCNEVLRFSVAEYEAVRAHPRRFAIVDGHEIPEAEFVVERHEGFTVVEKLDGAGEVAEETAPTRTP